MQINFYFLCVILFRISCLIAFDNNDLIAIPVNEVQNVFFLFLHWIVVEFRHRC